MKQITADLRRVGALKNRALQESQKWFESSTKLAEENSRLRAENLALGRQAATWQNNSLVTRSAEGILAAKLYNAEVRLTDVRRALGEACEYPQRVSRAVPLSYHWPHSPLDTHQLARKSYERIRFALGAEIYLAAATVAVPTDSQNE